MVAESCGACGSAAIVNGACCSCGKGVAYRKPMRYGPRKVKPHAHEWAYDGVTFESGTRQRRDRCGKCPAIRLIDLE